MSFGHGAVPGSRLHPDRAVLELGDPPTRVSLGSPRLLVGRSDPPLHRVDLDLAPWDAATPRTVSRLHAELLWVDGLLHVRDLGSRNGTKINGELLPRTPTPTEPHPLQAGDRITFGGIEARVLAAAP